MLVQKAYRWKRGMSGSGDRDAAGIDAREMGRRVVALSPHLDDAVFSLGATIARLARTGADVTIVTIFGGDPDSPIPAGEWDRRTGFSTAGEAAHARRIEDLRACAHVRATPVWHSFTDCQYKAGSRDDDLVAALEASLSGAETLLVPGFPLTHPDHARLTPLILRSRVFSGRLVLYSELPYGLWSGQAEVPNVMRSLVTDKLKWRGTRVAVRDVVLKLRACHAYSSQLPCFPERVAWRMSRHELVSNEVFALLDSA